MFLGALNTVICGGIAGTVLWVLIFPTDVVKSRIQVSGSTEPMIKVLKTIVRQEGKFDSFSLSFPVI